MPLCFKRFSESGRVVVYCQLIYTILDNKSNVGREPSQGSEGSLLEVTLQRCLQSQDTREQRSTSKEQDEFRSEVQGERKKCFVGDRHWVPWITRRDGRSCAGAG